MMRVYLGLMLTCACLGLMLACACLGLMLTWVYLGVSVEICVCLGLNVVVVIRACLGVSVADWILLRGGPLALLIGCCSWSSC